MDLFLFVLTLIAALCSALLAGNFFAFSAFFLRALGALSAERGIVAMQATIRSIKTLAFLILFFGTAALCAGLGGLALLRWGAPGTSFFLLGAALFLLGPFAVTLLRSVPLNNQLLAATPGTPEARDLWTRFQRAWVRWNHIRTITALLACACFTLALAAMGSPFDAG